jgi:hypothetical protein
VWCLPRRASGELVAPIQVLLGGSRRSGKHRVAETEKPRKGTRCKNTTAPATAPRRSPPGGSAGSRGPGQCPAQAPGRPAVRDEPPPPATATARSGGRVARRPPSRPVFSRASRDGDPHFSPRPRRALDAGCAARDRYTMLRRRMTAPTALGRRSARCRRPGVSAHSRCRRRRRRDPAACGSQPAQMVPGLLGGRFPDVPRVAVTRRVHRQLLGRPGRRFLSVPTKKLRPALGRRCRCVPTVRGPRHAQAQAVGRRPTEQDRHVQPRPKPDLGCRSRSTPPPATAKQYAAQRHPDEPVARLASRKRGGPKKLVMRSTAKHDHLGHRKGSTWCGRGAPRRGRYVTEPLGNDPRHQQPEHLGAVRDLPQRSTVARSEQAGSRRRGRCVLADPGGASAGSRHRPSSA